MATYQLDSQHTGAHFKVRHMMISNVKGEFSRITGSVEFDPSNPSTARVEATIESASVNTREPQRDSHLKSHDFLDVGRYPKITFLSRKIVSTGEDSYEIVGDLTIRGVTREVTLQVESLTPEIKDPDGLLRRGASATTRIERKDFGLTWNAVLESGGFVVGDEVDITIDVELVRKAESVFLRVGLYIVFCGLTILLSAQLLVWLCGYFLGATLSQFLAAIGANWLLLRIYGGLPLTVLGLYGNSDSARNLALGLAGGMGAAALTLAPPLAAHIATLTPDPRGARRLADRPVCDRRADGRRRQ